VISVLCVCSYNRTRSVLMEALLRSHLADLDVAAHVCSAGVRGSGGFVSTGVMTHLATLGLRCDPLAGTLLREAHIASADLVITAEHEHVVEIAARWPDAFRRTFTLPELLGRIRHVGGRLGGPMPDWIGR
jgi:protein-tyrosine-phosphatase